MYVGRDEVGSPGNDQVAVVNRLRIGAGDWPQRQVPGLLAAGVADGAGDQPAGPEGTEQAEQQAAVQQPLVRAVGISEQRLGAGLGDDLLPAAGDLVERRVPRYRREPPLPLGADPAQRRPDPVRRMHEFGVAVDLRAGETGGERVLRIALDPQHAAALDLGQQRAHVRTVMRADDANRFHSTLSARHGERSKAISGRQHPPGSRLLRRCTPRNDKFNPVMIPPSPDRRADK
jgi:hypothetical protein